MLVQSDTQRYTSAGTAGFWLGGKRVAGRVRANEYEYRLDGTSLAAPG